VLVGCSCVEGVGAFVELGGVGRVANCREEHGEELEYGCGEVRGCGA
jgi:hypothetical protein